MKPAPIAVIDLGSNTARAVVFRIEPEGTFEVVADDKVPLRLIRQIDARGRLRAEAGRRTLRVLADFRQIALGAGARRIITVATAALREASNGAEFLARARQETGLSIRLLSPRAEARCAFLGAVYGVAARHGLVLDIGGGSLQIGHFRDRRLLNTWSLPLGALRLSDRFLKHDPPGKPEIRRLRDFAAKQLARAGIPVLGEDELLIGTGGTIRNLGKIDTRLLGYPITRLHGYILTTGRIRELSALLCRRRGTSRVALPGLNAARADSIIGGSFLAEVVMTRVGAQKLLVAGHGLREGLILEALRLELPEPAAVRASAVRALVSRFTSWDERRATRRKQIVEMLASALLPPDSNFQREMLLHAAVILDIGRNVEYFRRHEHAAMILRSAGLDGFGHREILYLSVLMEVAEHFEWKERSCKPLLRNTDLVDITRSAVLLSLGDEIEHRIPARRAPHLLCRLAGNSVILGEPALAAWDPGIIADAFVRSFGRRLRISGARPSR